MSVYKSKDIKIVQIIGTDRVVFGLGSDEKIYYWNSVDGAWVKKWGETDKPE